MGKIKFPETHRPKIQKAMEDEIRAYCSSEEEFEEEKNYMLSMILKQKHP